MSDMVGQILGAIEKVVDERFNSFETAVPGVVTAVRNDGRVDVMPSVRKMVTSGVIDRFDAPVRGVPLMQIGRYRDTAVHEPGRLAMEEAQVGKTV